MNRRRASASYVARASSGRPGSPHRYFEGSYDVILELMTGEGNGDDARKSGPSPDGDTTDDQPTLARVGRQVVHRHKNGLCIVTAGDVLERMVILGIDETNERNNDFGLPTLSCGDHPLSITALRFHVKVDKDAKSARGKIRSRNKNHRKRRNKPGNSVVMNEVENDAGNDIAHAGNVLPHDPLCTVSLSDGRQVQLYCCVGGTIIEVNHSLLFTNRTNCRHER